MTILDNIRAAGNALLGKPKIEPGVAYGNMWPNWEVQSPQYPFPNAYNLAQMGYRKDELVYACIQYRAVTVAEPTAVIVRGKGKDKEPVGGLFDNFPRGQPNSEMSEVEFWQVAEIYRNIAGNAIFEIETNRLGEPINLWPLNPSYCSFRRGNDRPLDKVVYLYPGLNPVEIPREKLIIFQNFDPIYPLLKGLSPTAIAMRAIGVHSATSDFLNIFFQRGAIIQGYLKFAQSLNDQEADRAKKRWRESHGGVGNWGESNIGILGQGADFVPVQMNMKDMAFADIDGRTEAGICQVFGLSPILLGAKVGLNASTYSNYEQAMENYISIVLKPSWRWYAGEITQQLVPLLNDAPDVRCEFDTSEVSSLKEDEDAKWKRVLDGARANLIYRDEARAMLGLEPVDNDATVFLGITLTGGQAPAETARIADPEWVEEETPEPEPQVVTPSPFTTTTTGAPTFSAPTVTDEEQLKAWRALSLTTSAPIGTPFDEELARCKTNTQKRAVFEAHWPTKKVELDPVLELHRWNNIMEKKGAQPGHPFYGNQWTGGGGRGSGGSGRSGGNGGESGGGGNGKMKYSPQAKGEVHKLYRATNDISDAENVPLGSHWSDDPSVAKAYTDNPGFGGSNIVSADIDTGEMADWTDENGGTHAMIADLMGDDDEAYEMQNTWSGYQPFQVLENNSKLSKLASEKYDFVKFTDDFPDGATTFRRTR